MEQNFLLDSFFKGGPMMYPLLICSLLSLGVTLERLWCLLRVPGGRPDTRVAVTTLRMDRLSDAQLDEYLASGGWRGKAGAFGYQDRMGWIHVIKGSESNVVGLPMELLSEMLP